MKWSQVRRKLARVDRALDQAIARTEIPGAVVMARMRREGEILEHLSVRGLAVVRPERIPMTRETVFDLASLTKPMATATACLLLVADGAISLDDPVVRHLPTFAERDKEGVTIRHLLTHSSGLKPWRAFHEPLLERERKTGQRLVGTPEGRDRVLDRIRLSTTSVSSASSARSASTARASCTSATTDAVSRKPHAVGSRRPRIAPGDRGSSGGRSTIPTPTRWEVSRATLGSSPRRTT
jgi:hypothetical protein